MLPKDKSITKSSKSLTNRSGTQTPVQFVKGVGPRLGAILASRGIETVRDLCEFFPRAYEDRSKIFSVAELVEGQNATLSLTVVGSRVIPVPGRSILEVRASDPSGGLALKWFHAPRGMEVRFKPGVQFVATGVPKRYMGRVEIIHPEISFNKAADTTSGETPESENYGRIIPVYTEIEGVPSRTFRKVLWEALDKYGDLMTEDLPKRFVAARELPPLKQSVRFLHFPDEKAFSIEDLLNFKTPFHTRLAYEEFFKFEYLLLQQKMKMEKLVAPAIGPNGGAAALENLRKSLPFLLTRGQEGTLKEILGDLARPHPMNRLVQGDVGSGKTAVALLVGGAAVAEGAQVAFMAPTEILAEQHVISSQKLFKGKLPVLLLTGKTPVSERKVLLAKLAAGEPCVLIGTHALLEDPVIFKNLQLIMIDEQHRFGVEQRRTLRQKGTRDGVDGQPVFPHTLVLTATPIPRTLALTAYGDLSVSTIRERPPGRSPVNTFIVRPDGRERAYSKIRMELQAGRQAYFIFPLVSESEAEGFTELRDAISESERLQKEVFPEFRVGLLHGQMKSDEKSAVMESFKQGLVHILVSTTVVEVGVDVPNATVIAIEHSERFGLSQLHQLRGRVGRGDKQSTCFLFTARRAGETSEQRLEVLERSQDGFEIAEADLEIRGPGEFLGTRQSGSLPFKFADLVRDREQLIRARDDVQTLLAEDPKLESPETSPFRVYLEREGYTQSERLKTS